VSQKALGFSSGFNEGTLTAAVSVRFNYIYIYTHVEVQIIGVTTKLAYYQQKET
jgi:hypothetical protein